MPANKDDSFKSLVNAIKETKAGIEMFLPQLEGYVKDIIENKSTDKQEIEHLLDTISSAMYMGVGKKLYLTLLEYYKNVNSAGADFYWKIYEEVTG